MADDFDDLMDMLDMDDGVMTPEEAFIHEYSIGQYPKLHNIAFHLRQVLANFEFYKSSGIQLTKSTVLNGLPQRVQITRREAAAILLESYLWSNLRHRVDPALGINRKDICDVNKLVNAILEAKDEYLQKIINVG